MTSGIDKAIAYCTAGSAACDAGDYPYALECFEKAGQCDPSNARVDYERGVTLERMGREDEAEVAYRSCLKRWPDHDMALSNLGSILRAREKFREALEMLDRAVRANPSREEAWFHKGMCHRSLGQLDQARDSLERALKLKPRDADDWHWLGVVMQEAGRFRDALVCFAGVRKFSGKAPQIAFATQRSGMCGQQAALGKPRPGADAYLRGVLSCMDKSDRGPALQIVMKDFSDVCEFLSDAGNMSAVAAVREEIASLRHALALS